mgnify:CR=1 FL=1
MGAHLILGQEVRFKSVLFHQMYDTTLRHKPSARVFSVRCAKAAE